MNGHAVAGAVGDPLYRGGGDEVLRIPDAEAGSSGQTGVARYECDLEAAPSNDHVHRIGHRDVVSHAPRLAEQRCGGNTTDAEVEKLLEGRLRLGGRHLTAEFDAPQGGGALEVEVIRDDDLVGCEN